MKRDSDSIAEASVEAHRERIFSIKTPLRPSYQEYFPRFNTWELVDRSRYLPPHLATLLTAPNISKFNSTFGANWWETYCKSSSESRASLLGEVLCHVGYELPVVRAICDTPREVFCHPEVSPYCWLNWSIPSFEGAALSAPGIVAHYLAVASAHATFDWSAALEIGVGTGYHAAALSYMIPQLRIVGVEAIVELAEWAKQRLRSLGHLDIDICTHSIRPKQLLDFAPLDYIYATAAYKSDLTAQASRALKSGGLVTSVRPLRPEEYDASPADIWLKSEWPTYSAYRKQGWNAASVISSSRHTGGVIEQVGDLYGVTFVPWQTEVVSSRHIGRNSALEVLLNQWPTSGGVK